MARPPCRVRSRRGPERSADGADRGVAGRLDIGLGRGGVADGARHSAGQCSDLGSPKLGDLARFSNPSRLMASLGVAPSEQFTTNRAWRMSAATIDRALRDIKGMPEEQYAAGRRRRLAISLSVPLRLPAG
jgi:hypothetical protein